MHSSLGVFQFGTYPTPVQRLERLSSDKTELWVKRDDLTDSRYGGTKVRKLGPLLAEAASRGVSRLVTVGALGSHHVLATGLFGKLSDFSVEAVVLPRPQSTYVREVTRASLGQGVRLVPVASYAQAMRHVTKRTAEGVWFIPAGGSNRVGSLALQAAAAELAEQVSAGLLPEPELIVLPLGTGGTAAGLAAGLLRTRLRTRVLAIAVAEPRQVLVNRARALAADLVEHSSRVEVAERLEIDGRYLGEGYGHPTAAGARASQVAEQCGLTLEDTYTEKAFAAVLDRVALAREKTVLFWQTHSSAALSPLLNEAPADHELPAEIRSLARDNGPRRPPNS